MTSTTFKFSELELELLSESQLKPKIEACNLVSGNDFTDYMFEASWDSLEGWSKPKISPIHDVAMHPASKILQYGVQMFEAFKVFRGGDGKLRLFRPNLHIRRLLAGAERLSLPQFDGEEFLKCIKRLVTLEQDWMPVGKTSNMYIRPVFIATEPSLWTTASRKAMLYVILLPMPTIDGAGLNIAMSLLTDPPSVRAWPGGSGDMKFGGNYGRTVTSNEMAKKAGHHYILWLFGEDHQLTEIGIMNIFIFMENRNGEKELVTPPPDGLILPGVTRLSILELAREWKQFKVSERTITMNELIEANKENRVFEIFGTGTLKTITPVGNISHLGVNYKIPTVEQKDPLYKKLFNNLADISYGRLSHPWSVLM